MELFERSSRPTKCPAPYELGIELTTLNDGLKVPPYCFCFFLLRQFHPFPYSLLKLPLSLGILFLPHFVSEGSDSLSHFFALFFSKSVAHSLPSPFSPKSLCVFST